MHMPVRKTMLRLLPPLGTAWLSVSHVVSAAAPLPYPLPGTESEEERVLAYALRAGGLYSTNILRDDVQPLSGTAAFVGGELNWRYEGPVINGSVSGDLDYVNYHGGEAEAEVLGYASAISNIYLLPRSISWMISDYAGTGTIDPLATAAPGNFQIINVLETGPRAEFATGALSEWHAGATYSDVNAETSPIDHTKKDGFVEWSAGSVAGIELGAHLAAQSVRFAPDSTADDYRTKAVRLSAGRDARKLGLDLSAGRAVLSRATEPDFRTTTGQVGLSYRATPNSELALLGSRDLGGTGELLRGARSDGLPITTALVIGEPYVNERLVATLSRSDRGYGWNVSAARQTLDFLGADLDQQQRQVVAALSYEFGPRVVLQATAQNREITYTSIVRRDNVILLATGIAYRLSSAWQLLSRLAYIEYDSTDPEQAFEETSVSLIVEYRP